MNRFFGESFWQTRIFQFGKVVPIYLNSKTQGSFLFPFQFRKRFAFLIYSATIREELECGAKVKMSTHVSDEPISPTFSNENIP